MPGRYDYRGASTPLPSAQGARRAKACASGHRTAQPPKSSALPSALADSRPSRGGNRDLQAYRFLGACVPRSVAHLQHSHAGPGAEVAAGPRALPLARARTLPPLKSVRPHPRHCWDCFRTGRNPQAASSPEHPRPRHQVRAEGKRQQRQSRRVDHELARAAFDRRARAAGLMNRSARTDPAGTQALTSRLAAAMLRAFRSGRCCNCGCPPTRPLHTAPPR